MMLQLLKVSKVKNNFPIKELRYVPTINIFSTSLAERLVKVEYSLIYIQIIITFLLTRPAKFANHTYGESTGLAVTTKFALHTPSLPQSLT